MTPYVFLEKGIVKTINIFNKGVHERDFTHIMVINYIVKVFEKEKNKIKNNFEIFNACKGKSEKLLNI